MSSQWITGHVVKLLGLDEETVRTQITPMLEGIRDKVTLKRQLEDLVGFSPEAKSFVITYVNARFPPPAAAAAPAAAKQGPRTIKLGPAGPSLTRNAPAGSSKKTSSSSTASGSGSGSLPGGSSRPASGRASPVDPSVVDAFGKQGHVYIKGRLEEESAWAGVGRSASASGSRAGSGRTTPDGPRGQQGPQQPRYRQAGALVSNVAPTQRATPKPSRPSTPPPAPELTQAERDAIEAAKSDDVRRLEKLIRELVALDGSAELDEVQERRRKAKLKEPCFCLARLHPLSPYVPSCSACGFIACYLQLPHVPCPSCGLPLLTPLARQRVVRRIEGELAAQLQREEQERQAVERAKREIALVESGGGAFPTLGGPSAPAQTASQTQQGRKVLTLGGGQGGKTKGKPSVTTYTKSAIPAPVAKVARPAEPKVMRVPWPTASALSEQELNQLHERDRLFRAQTGRRFARLPLMREGLGVEDVPEAIYVPIKEPVANEEQASGKRGKKKGKGVDGAIVPGAG